MCYVRLADLFAARKWNYRGESPAAANAFDVTSPPSKESEPMMMLSCIAACRMKKMVALCCIVWAVCAVGLALQAEEPDALRARSPREVAEQLAAVYGHRLDPVAYIP